MNLIDKRHNMYVNKTINIRLEKENINSKLNKDSIKIRKLNVHLFHEYIIKSLSWINFFKLVLLRSSSNIFHFYIIFSRKCQDRNMKTYAYSMQVYLFTYRLFEPTY